VLPLADNVPESYVTGAAIFALVVHGSTPSDESKKGQKMTVNDQPLVIERVITDQKSTLPVVQLTFAWIFAIALLGYTIPWVVACHRRKSNCAAIAVLNWMLGWTGIGWIIALTMACGPHTPITLSREVVS